MIWRVKIFAHRGKNYRHIVDVAKLGPNFSPLLAGHFHIPERCCNGPPDGVSGQWYQISNDCKSTAKPDLKSTAKTDPKADQPTNPQADYHHDRPEGRPVYRNARPSRHAD